MLATFTFWDVVWSMLILTGLVLFIWMFITCFAGPVHAARRLRLGQGRVDDRLPRPPVLRLPDLPGRPPSTGDQVAGTPVRAPAPISNSGLGTLAQSRATRPLG